jgi:hypothetical protein
MDWGGGEVDDLSGKPNFFGAALGWVLVVGLGSIAVYAVAKNLSFLFL